jgi:hypothetical protein
LVPLIEQIRTAASQQAWGQIQNLLKTELSRRIHAVLDGLSEDETEPDAGLSDCLERRFWRDVWRMRKDLPSDASAFAECLGRLSVEQANRIAGQYDLFLRKLAQCKPPIRAELLKVLGGGAAELAQALASQVRRRLWDRRNGLPADCEAFNAVATDVVCEIGRRSLLFRRAAQGEAAAAEEVFQEFRQYMLAICDRVYWQIPASEREDILQDALLSIWKTVVAGKSLSGALALDRISTWRAFLRTVVIRAGRKWKKARIRYVRESELGARNRG